ncbi:ABC-type nickel/cobalt efflux system permease component RcnA [Breoghania corrubedonensis]|uniref:Nickel/cobalt efflux system n=1 Tax=Breoghania corrubedonensis TaxID=665038 RepID=A0A2T5VHP5_9HYPH|nr:nickel/cobalt transporter [Breoghania corrubedonensis]PTW63287.1 ABC-type nickel/cobalt efflux system permease component RcnA [Breoghania corrubedonensis]
MALVLTALVMSAEIARAANSPFGVGLPEPSTVPGGWFAGFFGWIARNQANFYRSLTASLQDLKTDGHAGWWLAGLSFAYGVFHAAGPGHGKAVISTYVLANRQTVKKAVVLSFASAMAQAMTAVLLIGIAAVVLNMTSIAITKTTAIFEVGSYAMITALGAWMIWTKAFRGLLRVPAFAEPGHDHHHDHQHGHGHHGHDHHGHDHSDAHGACGGCGHAHAPDPIMLEKPITLARAWSVILAVGLRPCTGALIVLVFALSQGLVLAGIASTFVMALGTGLTVSALAVFAVTARGLAMRFAGEASPLGHRLHRMVEIGGSVLVFALGLILLIATLGWG